MKNWVWGNIELEEVNEQTRLRLALDLASSSSSVLSSPYYVATPLLRALLSSQCHCFVASSPRYVV
ncbi:hypothetical protein S245_037749 [Arachis hypogaea]